MELKQEKQLKEEKPELEKMIAVNQINVGPHWEIPADRYYAQIEMFENMYNIKFNKEE